MRNVPQQMQFSVRIGQLIQQHTRFGGTGVVHRLKVEKIGADFVTEDYRELLNQPEVTAVIIATDEHLHVEPILASVERGVPMLIEKPLATDLAQSAKVLKAIEDAPGRYVKER